MDGGSVNIDVQRISHERDAPWPTARFLDSIQYPRGAGEIGLGSWCTTPAILVPSPLRTPSCGDDLTRAKVMRQVASLHDVVVPMLLPDISINTSPTRFVPINQEQMRRFNRTSWERSATFVPLVAGTNGRKA